MVARLSTRPLGDFSIRRQSNATLVTVLSTLGLGIWVAANLVGNQAIRVLH